MGSRRRRDRDARRRGDTGDASPPQLQSRKPPQSPRAQSPHPSAHDAERLARFRSRLAAMALGVVTAPLRRIHAAIFLAAAGVLLIVAWQSAPQRMLDAHRYATFTERADGHIVESWLAMAWRPEDMGRDHLRWHAYAKASPCAVVEYGTGSAQWGTLRRAFCGNRFMLREEDGLHTIDTLAPGVPFDWLRDARGLALPEIRVSRASFEWLSTHAPYSTFFLGTPAPETALAALAEQVDSPVDATVASWRRGVQPIPLAYDPQRPGGAMPAGYVDLRRTVHRADWAVLVVAGGIGIFFWLAAMSLVLWSNMPLRARIVLALLPLLTLPWWSEQFPDALHTINADLSSVVADMVGDLDRTGRMVGSDPHDATLAGGERLAYPVGASFYGPTFGRLRLSRPEPPPRDADAALDALTRAASTQVRALPVAEQSALLAQLLKDKKDGHRRAGLAFVPAAREILTDPAADAELRAAARRFLSEWVVQPIVEPHPGDPDFRARLRIYRDLAALPIPEIAIMAQSVAERAAKGR